MKEFICDDEKVAVKKLQRVLDQNIPDLEPKVKDGKILLKQDVTTDEWNIIQVAINLCRLG